jgi:hypothetical protein
MKGNHQGTKHPLNPQSETMNEEDGAKIMTLESEENLNLNSHTVDT